MLCTFIKRTNNTRPKWVNSTLLKRTNIDSQMEGEATFPLMKAPSRMFPNARN